MSVSCQIVPLAQEHWGAVRAIYAEGLATGLAAFRLTPPLWKEWDASHLAMGRLMAQREGGGIIGWAALAAVADS